MKKCLSVVLVAVMLLCMNIGAYAKVDSYVVNFDIQAPSSVAKNEEFTVSVGVDMMKDHALSGTIQVGFDTSKIEYVSATAIGDNIETEDDFDLSSYYASVINDTQSGKVVVSFFSYDVCPEDYVKIVEIKFRAKSTGTTAFYVYTDDWWDEYNGVEYWDSWTDGKPKTNNAVHTISITEEEKDYCVDYVIEKPDEVTVGDEFTVSVGVDNMKNHIMACTLEFTYDCDMLELVSCKCPGTTNDGSFYNDEEREYMYSLNTLNPGTVIVSFAPFNNCVDDIVELIEFTFVAKHKGEAHISVTSDDWEDIYNGKTLWAIESNTPAPKGLETTISVNVAEKPAVPEIVYGDVNGDGKITAADARLTLRASARIDTFTDEQSKAGDVNFDKKITAADARLILRVSAKIDSFDIPVPVLRLDKNEYILHVNSSSEIKVFVDNGDLCSVDAEFSAADGYTCSEEDVLLSTERTADGAIINVNVKPIVLQRVLVGGSYAFERFSIIVSLTDSSGKSIAKREIKIELTYSEKELELYGNVQYLTENSFQKNDDTQCYEFLLAFTDKNRKQTSTYGLVNVDIENSKGENIYSKQHKFIPDDFEYWKKNATGESVFLVCISIPYSEIPAGYSTEGTIKFWIYTPFGRWNDKTLSVSCLPLDSSVDLTDPNICFDYGHTVKSGLCPRCSTYLGSDLGIVFVDENSNLLPAETTCNILGSRTAATINKIANVSAVKNYYGTYDIAITAEVELPSYVNSREPGFFTVCLIDFDTNTTVMSGQVSYSGYGKQRITFEMENIVPGDYAVMFVSIDIHR